jgi:hypothetical protein
MTIHVTPIPQLIELAAPAFTLGTANAAGAAATAVASNSTLLTFDTTLPAATGTAAVGTSTVAPRRDHVHASSIAATQAEMEAGSSTATFVSPGRTQYHPAVAKAYAAIDNGGALETGSYNIASVTDTGTGNRTVVFDVDFSAVLYVGVAGTNDGNVETIKIMTDNSAVGSSVLKIWASNTAGGETQAIIRDRPTTTAYFGDQ